MEFQNKELNTLKTQNKNLNDSCEYLELKDNQRKEIYDTISNSYVLSF